MTKKAKTKLTLNNKVKTDEIIINRSVKIDEPIPTALLITNTKTFKLYLLHPLDMQIWDQSTNLKKYFLNIF